VLAVGVVSSDVYRCILWCLGPPSATCYASCPSLVYAVTHIYVLTHTRPFSLYWFLRGLSCYAALLGLVCRLTSIPSLLSASSAFRATALRALSVARTRRNEIVYKGSLSVYATAGGMAATAGAAVPTVDCE
jgi:hypothetical protein